MHLCWGAVAGDAGSIRNLRRMRLVFSAPAYDGGSKDEVNGQSYPRSGEGEDRSRKGSSKGKLRCRYRCRAPGRSRMC